MKVLVAHPAQQHSYRLATALSKKRMLYKYATTVYYRKGSVTNIIVHFLKGNYREKAELRKCQELKDTQVVQFCEIGGLFKLLTMNVPMFRFLYRKVKYHNADRFAKQVASYAIAHHVDAVVGYDDYSSTMFNILRKKAPEILRIMDVSAANILYMRQIYEKDIEISPNFAGRLREERKVVWDPETIARTKEELKDAELLLAPSSFVARSLEYSGVRKESIKICPYGVDNISFSQKEYEKLGTPLKRPIRFVYVGGVKELKGISYLLEAVNNMPPSLAELTIVGQFDKTSEDILPYSKRVHFTGQLLHSDVSKALKESDVFVFPSLGEGLSLAALEAASCGLPLIVSENSGINDAVINGEEGFVIPIQSSEAIEMKMRWFIEHPDQIEIMGKAARKMAMRYTWDNYYGRIGEIFEEIEEGGINGYGKDG